MTLFLLIQCVALAIAGCAAVTDHRTGEIPNWLTLPAIGLAVVTHGVLGGWSGFLASIIATIACGLVPYLMFRKGAAGGGDVKLFAALGAIAGLNFGIETQLFAFAAGSFYALARLAWQGRLLRVLSNSLFLVLNLILPRSWRRELTPELMTSIRLGVPILFGALCAFAVRYPPLWQ